jgi:hypothetical protein
MAPRHQARNQKESIWNGDYTSQLVEDWNDFVGHIPDSEKHKKESTAMLLQNTIDEAHRDGQAGDMLQESTTNTKAVADYASTIFPVLMRVFPNLIAHDLVSIQPLGGPVGAVFNLEYKHGSSKGQINEGDNMVQNFDPYYTSEEVWNEDLVEGNGTDFGGSGGQTLSTELQWTPVKPNQEDYDGAKVIIKELKQDGSVRQKAIDQGNGGFAFTPSGSNTSGSISYQSGGIQNFKFEKTPENGNRIVAHYYYDQEGNEQQPEMRLDVALHELRATSRKLKVMWSAEATDDLRAQHGIRGEAQLLIGMSNEIGLEIDREILQKIRRDAQTIKTWDRQGATAGMDEVSYLRTILTQLDDISAQIHNKSGRAPANWIVSNPRVSKLFRQLKSHGDFLPAAPTEERPSSYGDVTSDYGISKFGILGSRYRVYHDPLYPEDEVLMGLKGDSYLNAGFVYSPYVPLQMTQTFMDPDDQVNKKGLRTRDAMRTLREEYYGRLKIENFV